MAFSISKDLVGPFVEAVNSTFGMMVGAPAEKEGYFLRENHHVEYDISGVMGITGAALNGTIAISFPNDLAIEVVSSFLGEEQTEVNDIVIDGVGELINIVSGEAKRILEEKKVNFNISIPAVVQGHAHRIANKSDVPHVLIAFKSASGKPFAIQLAVEVAGAQIEA